MRVVFDTNVLLSGVFARGVCEALLDACRDGDDLPVLGTLLAAKADCLVTGDQDLLELREFHSIPILSPRAFHDRLG